MNPANTGFDVSKPPILVYVKRGGPWQLVAFEWVFAQEPAKPPLPGATYGSFPAASHHAEGTFVPAAAEADCAETSPSAAPLSASGTPSRDAAPLGLVPESPRHLRGHEPLVRPFNAGRIERRSGH